jgi:hypothetical protein
VPADVRESIHEDESIFPFMNQEGPVETRAPAKDASLGLLSLDVLYSPGCGHILHKQPQIGFRNAQVSFPSDANDLPLDFLANFKNANGVVECEKSLRGRPGIEKEHLAPEII